MKLTALFVTLSAFVACASAVPAKSKAVPWEQIHHKDARYWKFYTEHKGACLSSAKPKYHQCQVVDREHLHEMFDHTFVNNKQFEFVQVDNNHISANCIDCSPQVMGNYYSTKIGSQIACKMYENTPINPDAK